MASLLYSEGQLVFYILSIDAKAFLIIFYLFSAVFHYESHEAYAYGMEKFETAEHVNFCGKVVALKYLEGRFFLTIVIVIFTELSLLINRRN